MNDYRQIFYERYHSAFKSHTMGEADHEFAAGKLSPIVEPWCRGLGRDLPVVDLGCGNGSLLYVLKELGFRNLMGVDISSEQVEIARRVIPEVQVGDVLTYLESFADDHFELITLFDVIEHLRKDEVVALMTSVSRKLRPGGVFICHCPNADSPFIGNIQFGDFTHETMLNPSSASNLCRLFELEEFAACEHAGLSPNLAGKLRGLAWKLLHGGIKLWNLIETGHPGSGVFTRNFAFKAARQAKPRA